MAIRERGGHNRYSGGREPQKILSHEKNPQAVDNQMDDDPRRSVPDSLSDEGDDPGGK